MSGCLHYLDDFLTIRAAGSKECDELEVCERLGLPIAGPTTVGCRVRHGSNGHAAPTTEVRASERSGHAMAR